MTARKATDQRLLEATLAYVASHADRRFDAFRRAAADWGEDWTGIAPVHLPASDLLADALPLAEPDTTERELMGLYVKERASRFWEQSYTAADEAVGADMLSGYGYTRDRRQARPLPERAAPGGPSVSSQPASTTPRTAIVPRRSMSSLPAPGRFAWTGIHPKGRPRAP